MINDHNSCKDCNVRYVCIDHNENKINVFTIVGYLYIIALMTRMVVMTVTITNAMPIMAVMAIMVIIPFMATNVLMTTWF